MPKRLTETVALGRPSSVEDGLIRGVRVLGPHSANGRTYSHQAITGAAHLYEGVGVNVNHSVGSRLVADRIGVLRGVRVSEGPGLSADLVYLQSHSIAATLKEAAERMPEALGFSHAVDANFSEGRREVSEILKVYSVDLVADPATTKGIFEQQRSEDSCGMTAEDLRRHLPDISEETIQALAESSLVVQEAFVERFKTERFVPISFSSAPAHTSSKPTDEWPSDFVRSIRS